VGTGYLLQTMPLLKCYGSNDPKPILGIELRVPLESDSYTHREKVFSLTVPSRWRVAENLLDEWNSKVGEVKSQ
jgi:hypothetical protein